MLSCIVFECKSDHYNVNFGRLNWKICYQTKGKLVRHLCAYIYIGHILHLICFTYDYAHHVPHT